MSFRGQLIKAGIDSNGTDVAIFNGSLTLQTDNKLIFRDSGCFIHSNADGYLTIEADTAVVIAADLTLTGAITYTGTLTIGTYAIGISFTGAYTTAAIQIGTNSVPIVMAAYNDYAININTTSAVASNSGTPVNAFNLKSTTTGTQSEDWTMSVTSYTDIYSGNENTVGHFYSQWGTTSGIGPLGMASAVTAKMLLPTSCTGAFFAYYGKLNFPTSPGLIDPSTPGNSCGWFLLSTGGESGGKTNFDNNGLFMEIHNLTAGAGNLLSANARTMKCAIPAAGTITYLPLSTMEDGLGLGTTGTDHALGTTATKSAISIWTSSTATSGNVRPIFSEHTVLAASATGHRAEFRTINDAYLLGGWCNALKGYMDFGTSGQNSGLGSAVCAELRFPNMGNPSGSYFPMEIEAVLQTSSNFAGDYSSMGGFIFCGVTHATGTNFDTKGRFMMIRGLTAAASSILSADSQTLRVALNPSGSTLTERYMVLSDTENSIQFAGGTARAAALILGSTTTGFQVDGSPAFVADFYGSIATGAQAPATNWGTINSRLTLASGTVLTSGSFHCAGQFRLEIAGTATLAGWNVAILGYFKTATTGVVGGSAAYNAAIVGLLQLKSGFTDPSGWTAAFIAGTYDSSPGAITNYTAYLVHPGSSGLSNFDVGLLVGDSGATTGVEIRDCTTGILLEGGMTDGILISGAMSDNAIEITSTTDSGTAITITATTATTALDNMTLASSYTATTGWHVGIRSNVTYTPAGGAGYAGIYGFYGKAVIDGDFNNTEYTHGGKFRVDFTALAQCTNGIHCGLNGIVTANGSATFSATTQVYVLWLQNNSSVTLTGCDSGFICIDGNAQTGSMDCVFKMFAKDTPYLFDFVTGSNNGMLADATGESHAGSMWKISCLIAGTEYFMLVSAAPA